jgi:hypothetical protein
MAREAVLIAGGEMKLRISINASDILTDGIGRGLKSLRMILYDPQYSSPKPPEPQARTSGKKRVRVVDGWPHLFGRELKRLKRFSKHV